MNIEETDLPCSTCSGVLEQRTVPTDDLPLESDLDGPVVSIAECTNCGDRHYPAETLSVLHRQLVSSEESAETDRRTNDVTGGRP